MKNLILPGMPLLMIQPFDIPTGQKVFDKDSNRIGVVVVKETQYECIEAFVRFDTKEEIKASKLNCVII